MKRIRVLLSDDHAVFRSGLRMLLEAAGGIEVVGEAADGHQVVREAGRLLPDVVVMDIAMPMLNGLEATRQITKTLRLTRVLMLSAYDDDLYLRLAMQAGAAGYVIKETAGDDLIEGLRQIHQGRVFFRVPSFRRLVKQWEDRFVNGTPRRLVVKALTGRQTEILQLVAEGHTTKGIALILAISVKTVERHRQVVMDKLNIHEIASLTRYAISAGIVNADYSPICHPRAVTPHRRMSPASP
jgi:DNA-binding NarL/FixJ family response regulator